MKTKYLMIPTLAFLLVTCTQQSQNTAESESEEEKPKRGAEADLSEGQKVSFLNLNDGDEVTSPFTVQMGVEGMEVDPAGEPVVNKGHHHIIIEGDYVETMVVVPTDSMHLHFGQGQTETELDLPPGSYKLTMQFADGFHRSYGEQMSASINITVVEEE